jgi:hypothetical protein
MQRASTILRGRQVTTFASTLALALTAALAAALPAGAAAKPPPSVATGQVISVLPTVATVAGTVNPNGVATTYYFQYGLATEAGFGANSTEKSAGSGAADVSTTGSLTGLSPATSYHYRIVGVSSSGEVAGGTGLFTTPAAPTVVTGPASALTATSATLNGAVNPEALATTWYFEYGPTAAYGLKTAKEKLVASANPSNLSASVVHLAPQATYHFRLVAASSAGTSYGAGAVLITGLAVTLNPSASTIVFGGSVELTGAVASGVAGAVVALDSKGFAQTTYSGIASFITGVGGTWGFTVRPTSRTTYEAFTSGGSSSPVVISVRPAVYLSVGKSGQIATRVAGSTSFANHVLQLQRLSNGLWVTWKQVRLNARAKATFATALPAGRTAIRMAIGPFVLGINQAAPGYLAGFSRSVVYLQS